VRATQFGGDWEEYRRTANEETTVILLVEDDDGIRNLEEIARVSGVDVLFVGAADLSASLGTTRDDPRVTGAISKAIDVAKRHELATHVNLRRNDPETLAFWYRQGCRLFHFTDVTLFSNAVNDAVTADRNIVSDLKAPTTVASTH
jgi:2-keto-3-deoxy-L-rhamnonate aldolase RhmA